MKRTNIQYIYNVPVAALVLAACAGDDDGMARGGVPLELYAAVRIPPPTPRHGLPPKTEWEGRKVGLWISSSFSG